MKRVFINGISSKTGGGQSILISLLDSLQEYKGPYLFFILVPWESHVPRISSQHVKIFKYSWRKFIPFLGFNHFVIPWLIKKYKSDYLLNLADIPVPTYCKQIFLFDWAYAVYPESIVWKKMQLGEWFFRKAKLFFFKWYISWVDVMVAQTSIIAKRLERIYGFMDTTVVSNSYYPVQKKYIDKAFNLGLGFKFLLISRYYVNKNIEIVLPVAELIRERGLAFSLILTISERDDKRARKILNQITKKGLSEYVINLGTIPFDEIPVLYDQCDALFLPTLLESLSGAFLEAMAFKKPILCSDMDFSRNIAGDAAFYFNPLDPEEIVDLMEKIVKDEFLRREAVLKGEERFNTLTKNKLKPIEEYINIFDRIDLD